MSEQVGESILDLTATIMATVHRCGMWDPAQQKGGSRTTVEEHEFETNRIEQAGPGTDCRGYR
jgi:hypothetical protein